MSRREDWLARLTDVVMRHDRMPFAWGASDCLMFVADAVEAMTGRPMPRPAYATASEAMAALATLGAETPHDVLAGLFEEIPPAMAHYGDLAAVIDQHGRKAGAVCLGPMLCVKAERGLARVPRAFMQRAFRI